MLCTEDKMKKYKLLIIEDDKDISEMLESFLKTEGFEIEVAFTGQEGITKFRSSSYDLVILDLMLPIISGLEVLKLIREKSQLPIIILSAKDTDVDKAIGLRHGADDYVSKPFSMIEIVARIHAALRRVNAYSNVQEEETSLTCGNLIIDRSSFSVVKNNEPIKLTLKEFKILVLFVMNPKQVFTKAQLFESVWEDDYFGDENVINVHIRRLREKIEDDPSKPMYIKTLWGIGYKLGVN
jgi:DNA-binding response OmpR family regulator